MFKSLFNSTCNKNSQDVDDEHNNDLNIYQNTTIIMYLQVGEVLPRFIHKKCDRIMNKAKRFKRERTI